MALISSFEEDVFRDWSTSLTEKISESLDQPLIVREEKDGTLRVNFGGETRSLLREVCFLFRIAIQHFTTSNMFLGCLL
jgi:hypothetical protein